jgi:tRNA threonylcarbamoyladenosine biosynthesis protein TsaE
VNLQHWVTETNSEEETIALGRALAKAFVPPAWIGLEGSLGAGKTRLVQGVAEGLNYAGRVRSPTFVLENRYLADIPILHQDLYRLDAPGEDLLDGWDEHPGLVLVEWAQRAHQHPDRWIRIRLVEIGPTRRQIEIAWDRSTGALRQELLPPRARPRAPEPDYPDATKE